LVHQIIWGLWDCLQSFFEFILDQKVSKPVVYEDNTSVITCVAQKGGIIRAKYLRARMSIVIEAVVGQRVRISYIATGKIIVDCLTKLLDHQFAE
jgi:hypothetical protein